MRHHEIMDYLEQQYAMPGKVKETLLPLLVVEHFQKNQVLYSPSDISKKIWFVHSGYLCLYHYDREVTITELYKEGDIVLFCFTDEKKDSYLSVLADCVLTTVHYRKLLPHLKSGLISPDVEKLILMNEINRKIRVARSAKLSPEKRIRQLLEEIPEIFRIASSDEISSYLKISRETLRSFATPCK